jgi:hypothetical protein
LLFVTTRTVTEAEVSIVMSIRTDGKTLMEALDGNAIGEMLYHDGAK